MTPVSARVTGPEWQTARRVLTGASAGEPALPLAPARG